jgi:hypothetical protein
VSDAPQTPEALAVYHGAVLLDLREPGWVARIDTRTLDLRRSDRCILGQLYGHYLWGTERLRMQHRQALWRGFVLDADSADVRYYALERAWRAEIARRRAP